MGKGACEWRWNGEEEGGMLATSKHKNKQKIPADSGETACVLMGFAGRCLYTQPRRRAGVNFTFWSLDYNVSRI